MPEVAGRIGANRFRPSGIELHPVSGNYFVVAARQRAIAEVTPAGTGPGRPAVRSAVASQIEGIAFAPDGALIVADEGREGQRER